MQCLVHLLVALTLKCDLLELDLQALDPVDETLEVLLQDQDVEVAVLDFILSALNLKLLISERSLSQK